MINLKNEKEFQKSTNLVILETKEKIINLLEKAKVPITVNQMIIKEVKEVIDEAAENIVRKDRIEYEEYLNSEKEKKAKEEKKHKK